MTGKKCKEQSYHLKKDYNYGNSARNELWVADAFAEFECCE